MFKTLAVASAATVLLTSTAWAVSVSPFDTPLSAGDNTNGSATASAFEDFGATQLSFTAATDLDSETSITVNPYLVDLTGTPSNDITLEYAINGGATTVLPITVVDIGVGTIGATGVSVGLTTGDTLTFFINGTAGQSGNLVTFAVETTESLGVVPLAPAAAFTLVGALALGSMGRRRR